MMAVVAAAGVTLLLGIAMLRLFGGPTLYDRALAASSVITKAAVICAALALALDRADWIDAAFALLLTGFVFNVAVLKFFRARTFQSPLARPGGET